MHKQSLRFNKPLSVESLAYSHGLFCASHPGGVFIVVAFVVILCSLPFFITTSGDLNSPKPWRSQWLNYRTPVTTETGGPQWIINETNQFSARTPSWFVGLPLAIVQQVYVTVDLDCGNLGDLCRKSHYSKSRIAASHLITELEEAISICQPVIHPAAINFSHTLTQSDHPHSSHTPPHTSHTPPHTPSDGILSPSLDSIRNKWGKDKNGSLGYYSMKELLYGGFWEQEHQSANGGGWGNGHGLKSPEQHMFALTYVLQTTRDGFANLTKCVNALQTQWPKDGGDEDGVFQHFYFEPEWRLIDFAPLIGVYSIVFLYISFSVGKIDLVQSKVGLGFTACITVVASLTMSLGICTFFGVSISLSGSEIYPYVVITIGLENILIIVRAVISTPEEFEVKYRIAVGLSKEGWAIARNLLTLLCMNGLSILFINYKMREFFIIALVGLLCDAFLQLVLFLTALSIDLRRLELSDLHSQSVPLPDSPPTPDSPANKRGHPCPSSFVLATPLRKRSKRVKFVYFLARARPVSRSLMVAFSVILIAWFSNTETFHKMVANLLQTPPSTSPTPFTPVPGLAMPLDELNKLNVSEQGMDSDKLLNDRDLPIVTTPLQTGHDEEQDNDKAVDNSPDPSSGPYWIDLVTTLNISDVYVSRGAGDSGGGGVNGVWRTMVTTHWPRLLEHAGYKMEGRFLTLLPPINLNFYLGFSTQPSPSHHHSSTLARLLSHPHTLRAVFLVTLVVVILSYTIFLVRSSKKRHEKYQKTFKLKRYSTRVACLKGHKQDIDCVCVEDSLIVSASLDGDIRVWDGSPGKRRCVRTIHRSELCGEPPPNSEASDTNNRPAADGCEDDDDHTPSATPILNQRKALGPKTINPIAISHQLSLPPPASPSPLPTQSAPHMHPSHSSQPDPHHTHSHHVPVSTLSLGTTNQIAPRPEQSNIGNSQGKIVKSSSTHGLPTTSYKPHPLTPPPGLQMGVVKSGTHSPPPSPVQSPVYYNPQASNLLTEISKSQDTSVNYNPQATVQVASVIKLTPTPRMTPQRNSTNPPLNSRTAYRETQQPQRHHHDNTTHTQYPHSQEQHTGSTLVDGGSSERGRRYARQETRTQNVSSPSVVFSQGSSKEMKYPHNRTHSRTQSHGQLDYVNHSKESASLHDTRVQTTIVRGRSSVPHISLQVSPTGSNVPPIRRAPSGSSLQGAVGTLPGPHCATPPLERDMGTRRHSVHDSLSAQVTVTPGASKDFSSSSQPPHTMPVYYNAHASNLQSHSSKTLATSVYYSPHVSSQQLLSSKTPVYYTSSVSNLQDSSSVHIPVTVTAESSNQIAHSTTSKQHSSSVPRYNSSSEGASGSEHKHMSTRSLADSRGNETRISSIKSHVNRSHSVPNPAHNIPTPVHNIPNPTHNTPNPAHSIPTPVHNTPNPAHHAASSAHHPPNPAHYTPSPSHTNTSHTSHPRQGPGGIQVPLHPPTISNADHLVHIKPPPNTRLQNTGYVTPPLLPGTQFNLPPVTITTSITDSSRTVKVQSSSSANVPAIQVNNRTPSISTRLLASTADLNQPSSADDVATPTDTLATPPSPKDVVPPKGPRQRGHTRNRSLGNDLPHKRSLSSMGHSRNRSLGSITGPFPFPLQPLTSRPGSVGNLSVTSDAPGVCESQSPFPVLPQTPNPTTGYDFAGYFNLFSQYTANMALQYCCVPERELVSEPTVPPVWCMEIWNRTIAVGCGNGQVEAWNAETGSLIFCLNLGPVGVTTISINARGIITGHMDGSLNLIGHNGLVQQTVQSHDKPISVLRCHGERVIVGSYDTVVSVHRSVDLVSVNSLHIHDGNITDIVCVEGPTRGCVSGCSTGLVVHWDTDTGDCIHDYGQYKGSVGKLEWTGSSVVALFIEDSLRVWDCISGKLMYRLTLDGLCNSFAVLASRYVAVSFESHIVIYDLDTGRKHSEKYLPPDRGVVLINHILTLDEASIMCTSGKDIHIVPCQVKLKTD